MIIQNRIDDDNVEFNKNWTDYKEGFGHQSSSFWLGLDEIAYLTTQGVVLLEYEFKMNDGARAVAALYGVEISSEASDYTLTYSRICPLSTLTDDSWMWNDNTPFSTIDVDNDAMADVNCAALHGPWWFADCTNTITGASNPSNMFHGITQIRLWIY